jgi:acyl-[acyl-carrier-protein]-phospholipid O-acyltransferase/long-chain-fatty-acid--[acyl-carrier-protein] ligase
MLRLVVRLLLRILYGFRAYNVESLEAKGPVLLLPNHVSWLDWLFLGAVLDNDWKFVTSSTTAQASWLHRRVMVNRRTFPVDTNSPYSVRDISDHLASGGRLVLFPEGRISTTGTLMKLFDGTGFLVRKSNPTLITCYLRGANRIPFVRHKGWTKCFPRVTAHFSRPFHCPAIEHHSHSEERERLTDWLHDRLVEQQFDVEMEHGEASLPAAIARTAGHIPSRIAMEDISGAEVSYRRLLLGGRLLASRWREVLGPGRGERIGVLLPNVNALPVTLLSLWTDGRVPALLNYSSGIEGMRKSAKLAGLRHIVTSRAFLEKAKLDASPLQAGGCSLHYLEDIRQGISSATRLVGLVRQVLQPRTGYGELDLKPEDTAVILFTSGSEGLPKGVELTHRNLLANIRQAISVIDLTDDDRFFNALPLFHSFGLTGGTLFPLVRGCFTYLYPSPLHYRVIPTMVYQHSCTVMLATNTFLNGYARKAHPYDFSTVRYLIAGAEKVQTATFDLWSRKFGIRVLEGYGATECSPVISVNTRVAGRLGTAGRIVPGMEHRIEPVEGVAEGGRLLVRGPNIMKGYVNPDANARFQALGGWYDTGDIARIDEDGYVHILGRLKRFAKVSGEMVSLTAVEDALASLSPRFGPKCEIAVIARPDADKGELLVAVTNEPRVQLGDLRGALKEAGLTNLAAPREIRVVTAIPKLGSGKTDYRRLSAVLGKADADIAGSTSA